MPTQEEGEYKLDPQCPIRIHVGLAPRAQPFDESMDSLNTAIGVAQKSGFKVVMEKIRRGSPGFQNAGPILAHFLQSKATHLFIAADDMLYPADTIVRLVNDDKDIVSGIYRKNVITTIEPANAIESSEAFLKCYREGGVYQAEYASSHTMTIKRKVIEKMIVDYPELQYAMLGETHYGLFLPMIQDGRCFQDDWAFSIRARKSGFTIWYDFGCRLQHFCGDFLGLDLEGHNAWE